jgi:hypothetical protein
VGQAVNEDAHKMVNYLLIYMHRIVAQFEGKMRPLLPPTIFSLKVGVHKLDE